MPFSWIKGKLKAADSPFLRNVGWLGGSTALIRISRLLATIILARFLTKSDYGLAALVITINEFILVFTRNGVGTKLIQADADHVDILSREAYWLNWLFFIGLFLAQILTAFGVSWIYHDQRLILPICVLGLVLLIMPIGLVQAALIQREGRFKVIALAQLAQVSTDNILSALFAIAGLGLWAIVLPKVLVAPIWLFLMLKNHSWRPQGKLTSKHWGELMGFGSSILGVELLQTLRNNLDYLIVGRFLSLESLGVYYFAFNAGAGISLGIINSTKASILSHLSEARDNIRQFRNRYFQSLRVMGSLIVPLVLVQSTLAPLYVPIVFGERWTSAIPILILICLSVIPRPFADSASQLLIAINKTNWDLAWNILFTSIFAAALFIGVQWQALGVAIAVLVSHWLCLPLFTLFSSRFAFKHLAQTQSP
ncbi:lipopolysaccharide biosynthesis protein [Synechococcus sp. Cruz-9H2]|uniref:lipopolysaccharide biosynthesis protein n=1 Tax=unclassified Synechococcus TaxID=2626047 RepID=UPI0020CD69B7|nr:MULTISPECIES: lipopolysaccharide biosynthesis protein [unclassified Synechococcus]MCP9818531.1 lipopolysaccharide biosynthesis protein [Synechococcus sp. Cruz-9H2]MCP9842762.1 lipopolysaccharide biosynthesis protein [Synechococcus sp. Edmonson 11F2]MCP9855427.1 lipopolysaccharide biosynthesis protein [Synechococcus sp. Cruz-9C9]MCP9862326.1 lipopolysaccharide biosynthesis protein [Synechococcus sp. Cruz-7E5]MCP9869598.1 lipopolysaccharide biosynthesis protein [Synechococcus sp. Cruz-7B9]